MEVWKDIIGYEGLYQVSNFGNVRSLDNYKNNRGTQQLLKGRILKFLKKKTSYGCYLRVQLYKNGVVSKHPVHRLVAQAFVPNPSNYLEVNHKDENKENNYVDNLEWCDRVYNVNYGSGISKRVNSQHKKVVQYDKNMNVVRIWNSMLDTEMCGFNSVNVSGCCRGRQKTHKNYIWRYWDE